MTKEDKVKLKDLKDQLDKQSKGEDVLSSKPEDRLVTQDSYVKADSSKLIKITTDELSLLKGIEEKLTSQMKLDKQLYQTNKNRLKQLVIDKQREIDDKLSKERKKNTIKAENIQYQHDIMEKYYQEQNERLKQRNLMIEKKRKKDLDELTRFKKSYVRKLHTQFKEATKP